VLALPGAVIMAVVGELFAIRSGYYYVAVGGLIGALGYVGAAGYGPGDDLPPGATDELMAFLAAGLVGGAVYWLVAGRGAGLRSRRAERHGPETLPSGQQ
jgi:hypothetical protein